MPDPADDSPRTDNTELAALVQQRKRLSRQIGRLKRNGEDPSVLITDVAVISSQIKQLQSSIKEPKREKTVTSKGTKHSLGDLATFPDHYRAGCLHQDIGKSALTTREVKGQEIDRWQNYAQQHPAATIYHDKRWQTIFETNFKNQTRLIACFDNSNRIRGVLSITHMRSRLFGNFGVSLPYVNYAGVLSDTAQADHALVEYATHECEAAAGSHLEIREFGERENCATKKHKVTMILPLPATVDSLQKQLGAKLRSQIKKSGGKRASIHFGRHEQLDHFYRVFSTNMRDLGTPVYSKHFFASILDHFPQQAELVVTKIGTRPVAAGFLLAHRGTIEIPWASSLKSANHLQVNTFMYHRILLHAVERNMQFFDFGRSSRNANTFKFKRQWGAQPLQLFWNYRQIDASKPIDLSPDNPSFGLAIQVWKKLPLPLANSIGPQLIRFFP